MKVDIENAAPQPRNEHVEFSALVCTVIERLFEANPSQNGKFCLHITEGWLLMEK